MINSLSSHFISFHYFSVWFLFRSFLFAIRLLSGLILSSFPLIFLVFFGYSTKFFSFSLQFVRFYTFDLYAGWNVELSTIFHIDLFVYISEKKETKSKHQEKKNNKSWWIEISRAHIAFFFSHHINLTLLI